MVLFISHYQLILIPLWPVLWDYKVPIFEVPIMGTFTYSDDPTQYPTSMLTHSVSSYNHLTTKQQRAENQTLSASTRPPTFSISYLTFVFL